MAGSTVSADASICAARVLLACCLGTASPWTAGFEVASVGEDGEVLKWGGSARPGTSGGLVTWAFVAAGTPGSAGCLPYCARASRDDLPHFHATPLLDHRTTPFALEQLRPVFQEAFAAWARVADLQFRYVGIDATHTPIGQETNDSPMIRIGIWHFEGLSAYFSAGVSFPPALIGSAGHGHILINANVGFQLSDAEEGSRLPDFPAGGGLHLTDLHRMALHEIGHVIGLRGSRDADALMWHGGASATLQPQHQWRGPRPDDVAGARYLYGPARPTATAPPASVGTCRRRR